MSLLFGVGVDPAKIHVTIGDPDPVKAAERRLADAMESAAAADEQHARAIDEARSALASAHSAAAAALALVPTAGVLAVSPRYVGSIEVSPAKPEVVGIRVYFSGGGRATYDLGRTWDTDTTSGPTSGALLVDDAHERTIAMIPAGHWVRVEDVFQDAG